MYSSNETDTIRNNTGDCRNLTVWIYSAEPFFHALFILWIITWTKASRRASREVSADRWWRGASAHAYCTTALRTSHARAPSRHVTHNELAVLDTLSAVCARSETEAIKRKSHSRTTSVLNTSPLVQITFGKDLSQCCLNNSFSSVNQ